jgi:hypothetical protein
MNQERTQRETVAIEDALRELEQLLLLSFSDATFEVAPGLDDPGSVHLLASINAHDVDEVLDVIRDRLLEFQVEEGLPIHVIPVLPNVDRSA